MAKEDYIVDIGKSEVTFKGTPVAQFHSGTKEVSEYLADGKNRKRWIAEAIKAAPQYDPTGAFDPDGEGAWEEIEAVVLYEQSFYELFPAAPKPYDNKVDFLHPDIYEWVKDNHPKIVDHLYPKGPWNAYEAGMKGNRTIRPGDLVTQYLN